MGCCRVRENAYRRKLIVQIETVGIGLNTKKTTIVA